MEKLKIIAVDGSSVGDYHFPEGFEMVNPHQQAMFDAVLLEQASKHQGTHSTKTKAEVSGTGKKPYAQKHTGNARQGSRRNPHFVGGGVAFGPRPGKNYAKKMNRKVYKLAFQSALSVVLQKQKVTVLANDVFIADQKPSAKTMMSLLKALNLAGKKVLLIVNYNNYSLYLSARNLKDVIVKTSNQISVRDLLNGTHILVQQDSLNAILKVGA